MVAKCPVIGGSCQGGTSSGSVGGGGTNSHNNNNTTNGGGTHQTGSVVRKSGGGPPAVAGREVCGRKVQLREEVGSRWVLGRLTDFNEARAEHRFVADEEEEAENKREGGEGAEWLCLGKRLFRWVGGATSDAPPNPTYKDFPGDVAAIGWKVRVYWSEMGRWYTGHVRSFEQRSGRHEVRFCDGDVRFYTVRDEAVLWVERPRKRKGGDAEAATPTPTPGRKAARKEWKVNGDQEGDGSSEVRMLNGGRKDVGRRNGVGSSQGAATPSPPRQNSFAAAGRSGNERTTGAALETPDRKGFINGIKEEGETELSVWHLRPRKGLPLTGAYRNPRFSVLKARVGIFWEGDVRYYRGTISSFNELSGKYTICYDDNTKEELALEEEKFQWYGPRGRSSGYSSAIRDTMLELGAQGLPKQGSVPTPSPPSEEVRPVDPQVLISKRVFVYWAANGQYYEGEVLAYCKRRRAHLVWYKDGEVEWLDFGKEHVIWGEHARGCAFPAGLAEDEEPPRGRAAMGWRIAVFWKDDATFYEGKVTGYNCATGRHDVLYDDNETENLSLSSEKVIWRIPPNVGKEGRKASRKKSANNGKSKRSSPSERTDKEDGVASEQIQSETRGSTPHTSSPVQLVKCVLNQTRGKGRKNGTRTVQSSSKPRQSSRKRRNVAEGESEVIGPSHSGKQEPLTSSLKSSKCGQGCEDVHASGRDWRTSSVKLAQETDEVKSTKSMDEACMRVDEVPPGNATETAEEVATNGNSNEPADQDGCTTRSEVGTGDGQLGQSTARSLHDSDVTDRENLKDAEDIPEPGSPMSVDRDPPDVGGEEDVKPGALKEMPWDKLPSVDVTRLVRLPPEFGSLEVKLRITAGKPSATDSDQDCDVGPFLQLSKDMDARQDEPKDAATARHNLLQDRVVAIDSMLSAISRYEQAHQTVGHVASRCDQVAMSEVLTPDTIREAAARAAASQMHGSPCLLGNRKSSGFQFSSTSDPPPAKGHKKAGPSKSGSKKQKSLSSIVSAGTAARLNLPAVLAVQSVSAAPTLALPPTVCTAPLISQASQLVTHISPRATSQFGVSSVPAIVASFCNQPNSNPGYRLVSVDNADSKNRVLEMGGKQGEGTLRPSLPSPGSTLDVEAGSRHLLSKPMQDTGGGLVQVATNARSSDLKTLKALKDSKLDLEKAASGSAT